MINRYQHGPLVWVDLENPSNDEIQKIADEYHLNSLVAHDLGTLTLKPKVDLYENFIYLILHFPTLHRQTKSYAGDHEIDFVVGKKFIITARHNPSEAFHSFSKTFEASAVLDKGKRGTIGTHAGFIFFYMVSRLYESLTRELEGMKDGLREIENHIFTGKEREMVIILSEASRDLLYFKRSLSLHRDILESFEVAGRKLFGDDFGFHLRTLVGDYCRVRHSLQSNMEFFKELRETNNSLLSTKQNEVMKMFTILAFVTFPLSLAIDVATVPSESNPLTGHPQAFWIILLGTFFGCAIMFTFFRFKKWL